MTLPKGIGLSESRQQMADSTRKLTCPNYVVPKAPIRPACRKIRKTLCMPHLDRLIPQVSTGRAKLLSQRLRAWRPLSPHKGGGLWGVAWIYSRASSSATYLGGGGEGMTHVPQDHSSTCLPSGLNPQEIYTLASSSGAPEDRTRDPIMS